MSDQYRYVGDGKFYHRNDEPLVGGEVVALSETAAEAFGGQFELLDDAADPDEPPDGASDGDDADSADGAGNDDTDEEDDDEICGVEMSDGSICERPAGECPYHGGEE